MSSHKEVSILQTQEIEKLRSQLTVLQSKGIELFILQERQKQIDINLIKLFEVVNQLKKLIDEFKAKSLLAKIMSIGQFLVNLLSIFNTQSKIITNIDKPL